MKQFIVIIFLNFISLCAVSQTEKSLPHYFDTTLTAPPVSMDKAKLYLKKGEAENALWVAIVNAADHREEANHIAKEVKKEKTDSTFIALIENAFYTYAPYIHHFIFEAEDELRNLDYFDMRKNELVAEVTEQGAMALKHHRNALRSLILNKKEAINELTKARIIIPTARRYALIAEIYEMENDNKNAEIYYNEAIKLQPHVEYYFRRANVKGLNNKLEESINDLMYVINMNYTPLLRNSYMLLGEAYLNLKIYQKSIKNFTKALEIHKDAQAYRLRGKAYLFSDQLDAANSDFKKAIELDPNSAESYYYLCYTLDDFEKKICR